MGEKTNKMSFMMGEKIIGSRVKASVFLFFSILLASFFLSSPSTFAAAKQSSLNLTMQTGKLVMTLSRNHW